MTRDEGAPDPRRETLGRLTAAVYWYLVVEGAFLLAALPGFVGILLLERAPSNIPLYALCLLPVGPAFSATISTLAARRRSDELVVWRRFWRSYVDNVRDVLWLWLPALVVASVLGVNIAFGAAAGLDWFFVGASIVLLGVVAIWSAQAILIASLFRFRTRDTARLALYYLAAKPLVTLGVVGYLLIAVLVVAFTSDWVLALLGVFFAAFALLNARAMVDDISRRFVAEADGADPPDPDQ